MKGDSEASWIGEVVGGKYRIVRLLAKGGMGVVYEAQHAVVRRRFAIKFLRRDLAERRDILNRFQREAEAAGALENDNLAASVDFGISDDGTPYIVMEYLVGEDLATLLEREGRLPISRAADLVAQACRGVGAAHAAGIVHRDLKPHNLFVCRRDDGTDLIKVLDFGVAKLQALDESSAATRTGMVLGTAAYMSPEQARGEKMVDHRTDVYALGAILYELLSLRRPHPGESQNAILHHIATQPPVPLESLQPDLPAELVAVVGRTLSPDPAKRPPSVEALAQAVAPFARREVWPAAPSDSAGVRVGALSSTMLVDSGPGSVVAPTADDRAPHLAAAVTVDDGALDPASASAGGRASTPGSASAEGRAPILAPASAGGRTSSVAMPRRGARVWIGAAVGALGVVTIVWATGAFRRAPAPPRLALPAQAAALGPGVVPSGAPPSAAMAGPSTVNTLPPAARSGPELEVGASSHRTSLSARDPSPGEPSEDLPPGLSGRPGPKAVGRPSVHSERHPTGAAPSDESSKSRAAASLHAERPSATTPNFDPDNPYR